VTEAESLRDKSGRLYSHFNDALVTGNLQNAEILFDDDAINQSSGKRVRRLVAKHR
jgi:hypothetical protein